MGDFCRLLFYARVVEKATVFCGAACPRHKKGEKMENNKPSLTDMLLLHLMIAGYSCSGIFTKLAAGESFLSLKFCLFYGMVILILFLYAIGWQQIIKRIPLTLAYSAKAAAVVWGMIWGVMLFKDKISFNNIIGAVLIIAGIVLYFKSEGAQDKDA